MIPNAYFRTVQLLRYVYGWDYFLLANEVIFMGFILYYAVEEILEIKKHKISYFSSVWNNLDVVVLIVSNSNLILILKCNETYFDINLFTVVRNLHWIDSLLHNCG